MTEKMISKAINFDITLMSRKAIKNYLTLFYFLPFLCFFLYLHIRLFVV